MTIDDFESNDLACVPDAIPVCDRADHFALARELLLHEALELTDLEDGYAFRFAADALEQLQRFIASERLCCPFLAFEVVVTPRSGPVWLRMTGPSGTREVLQAELELPESCGCSCEIPG